MTHRLPPFLESPDPTIYSGDDYVVLDFETTTHSKGSALDSRNGLVLSCWRLGQDHPDSAARAQSRSGGTDNHSWDDEFRLTRLVQDIARASFVVAHNAKFELQWLERCGLDLSTVLVWDTMIGDYVIGGNRWQLHQLSLDRCAARRKLGTKVNVVSKMISAGVCPSEIPRGWLLEYCQQDVALCERLFLQQRREMQEKGLLPTMFTRCLATPVLADLEKNGMQLDGEVVRTKLVELEMRHAEVCEALEKMTGGINLNSPLQLAEYLYDVLKLPEPRRRQGGAWVPDRTPTGLRRTDAETVDALPARNKRQERFLALYREYKGTHNELTKYLRKFEQCVDEAGGLLRASFNQCNTRTHRLSSSGTVYRTQFQNLQRDYKPVFMAREEGWLVGEGDGAQLEFRVAAHLGRDRVALADILDGTDVHRVSADIIGVSRQDAKAHTFKPLYGGTSGTPAEKAYYQYFQERYAGITATQRTWIDTVLATKSLTTETGLTYYWPNTRMDTSGYITNTTAICNYPVQGLATAEIIPIALVYFWHRIRAEGLSMFLVNTVHDSIIAELPPEEVDDFHRLCRQCLIDDVYSYLACTYKLEFTVPLAAGVKVASHWSGDDAAAHVPEGVEHKKGEVVYTAEGDFL